MTIQGAMKELVNLLNADDIPIYYKGGIKKAIETIDDYIDGKDDYVKRMADRKTENSSEKPNNCEECKHWNDTEDGCADRHGCRATTEDCSTVKPQNYCDDCLYCDTCDSKEFFYACTSKATISKMEQVDEPQKCSVNGRPYTDCCNCEYFKCTADEPQTERSE